MYRVRSLLGSWVITSVAANSTTCMCSSLTIPSVSAWWATSDPWDSNQERWNSSLIDSDGRRGANMRPSLTPATQAVAFALEDLRGGTMAPTTCSSADMLRCGQERDVMPKR